MKIHIKRRSQSGWAIAVIIILPFIFGLLNGLLGLPHAIWYVIDLAWVFAAVLMIFNRHLYSKSMKLILLYVMLFLAYTFVTYLVNFQSPLYYLWAVRNNFRYYFAFLVMVLFLKVGDVGDYFKLFTNLFWLNVAVSLVQYFVFGYNRDNLGGIFGVETGVNGFTNLFFCIMVAWTLLNYMEGKASFFNSAAVCIFALMIAAMAELKFFFVEFIMIVGLSSLITKFSLRKLAILSGALFAVALFAALLVVIFPQYSGFLSIDYFLQSASSEKGYTAAGDLNRLNAFSRINDLWLTTGLERVFGLGFGNSETASYTFLNTPFYEKYGHMHYTWLSYAIMYLECGWIGLFFYYGFFVLVYFKATNIQKRISGVGAIYCKLARIMSIMCVVISIYNSSLRTEAGYMAFFVLSVPFIFAKESPVHCNIENQIGVHNW